METVRPFFIVIPLGYTYLYEHPTKGISWYPDCALRNELDLHVCEFVRNNGLFDASGQHIDGSVFMVVPHDYENEVMFCLRTGIIGFSEYIPVPRSLGLGEDDDLETIRSSYAVRVKNWGLLG